MEKDEIINFLRASGQDECLFKRAGETRKRCCGDKVHLRGIIEFSNYCCRSCTYCGLRKENRRLKRYRMSAEEIVERALIVNSLGVRTIVLQSGDDFYYSRDVLCGIISRIKKEADLAITLSLGERPLDDYRAFRNAGADRYLLKHETANEKLYGRLHPGCSLKNRLNILEHLRALGYQIGAGCIVGLPGQTEENLCMDILLLKALDPDMASVGPFIAQEDTPLSGFPTGDLSLSMRVLALTRIVTGNSHLPATTAVVTVSPETGLSAAMKAGANVIMPDFTPSGYRRHYAIYDNKAHITLEKAMLSIRKEGRQMARDRGDSLKRVGKVANA